MLWAARELDGRDDLLRCRHHILILDRISVGEDLVELLIALFDAVRHAARHGRVARLDGRVHLVNRDAGVRIEFLERAASGSVNVTNQPAGRVDLLGAQGPYALAESPLLARATAHRPQNPAPARSPHHFQVHASFVFGDLLPHLAYPHFRHGRRLQPYRVRGGLQSVSESG